MHMFDLEITIEKGNTLGSDGVGGCHLFMGMMKMMATPIPLTTLHI